MTTSQEHESEWYLWFEIEPEDFDGPDWGGPDDPDGFFPDPRMTPVPYAFVGRLRELIPTWRELGLTYEQTGGVYDDGRVWVLLSVGDKEAKLSVGDIRVDLTESEWVGSWVRGGNPTDSVLENAEPMGEPIRESFDDPESGIEGAIRWMLAQFERPIIRRVWRSDDQIVAESWTFDDTGKIIVVSGEQRHWSRPETADEAVRVGR